MLEVAKHRSTRRGEESVPFFEETLLQVAPASLSCHRAVFIAKLQVLESLHAHSMIDRRRTVYFSRPGLLSFSIASMVGREVDNCENSLAFYGDLSPTGLATYLSLIAGGYPWRRRKSSLRTAKYLGIGDEWISLCCTFSKDKKIHPASGVPVSMLTRLSKKERDLVDALVAAGLDLESLVGRVSAAIILNGASVDMYMASDPTRYEVGFSESLSALLARQVGGRDRPSAPAASS